MDHSPVKQGGPYLYVDQVNSNLAWPTQGEEVPDKDAEIAA